METPPSTLNTPPHAMRTRSASRCAPNGSRPEMASNVAKVAKVTKASSITEKVSKRAKGKHATKLAEHVDGNPTNPTPEQQDGPLMEFTLFPKLPLELRFKIFKFALPYGNDKILRIRPNVLPYGNDNFDRSSLTFAVDDPIRPSKASKAWFPTPNLLSVCRDSRKVFLENFKGFLQTNNGSIIRFDDTTIIYITNFSYFYNHPALVEAVKTHKGERPLCLGTVAKLAVYVWEIWSYLAKLTLSQVVSQFGNLSHLFGLVKEEVYPNYPESLLNRIRADLMRLQEQLKVEMNVAVLKDDDSLEITS